MMEELLALARDCSVSITFDALNGHRFDCRKTVGGKQYGCGFFIPVRLDEPALDDLLRRRLKEMQRAMNVGMADAA